MSNVLSHACPVYDTPLKGASADHHGPAVNTAAVVTYAADTNGQHWINGIAFSYLGAAPTGGNLKIEDGGTTIFSMDIKAEGHGVVPFPRPKMGTINTAMTITLAAGGASCAGKVSILGHGIHR